MVPTEKVSRLKALASDKTLLYVEDNQRMQEQVTHVLQSFFQEVVPALSGEEGYDRYMKKRPDIVITDIRMGVMDGLTMAEKIKKVNPSAKIIVMSAYDDKAYLFRSVDIGIFHYIKKPLKVDEFVDTLIRCIEKLHAEEDSRLFQAYTRDMLNHHTDLLLLISGAEPLFASQKFYDFFGVGTLEMFGERYGDLGSLLLKHNSFLYNHDRIHWLEELRKHPDRLYHAKIADMSGENRHFIMKLHPIPEKPGYAILSLNDITSLNLLGVFDSEAVTHDEQLRNKKTVLDLLKVIHQNQAELKIYNYYKGLTITHPGIVDAIDDNGAIIKTSYLQQKAIQYQRGMLLSSELFPHSIECAPLERIDFEAQTVHCNAMRFIEKSPKQRKAVRVEPDAKHTVSLFIEDRKYYGECRIQDLSVDAVKLTLDALPAGMKCGNTVTVDMVLESERMPLIIHNAGEIIRIDELPRKYYIVVYFEKIAKNRKLLVEYISKRQMQLIREFKGVQFG